MEADATNFPSVPNKMKRGSDLSLLGHNGSHLLELVLASGNRLALLSSFRIDDGRYFDTSSISFRVLRQHLRLYRRHGNWISPVGYS